MRYLACLAAVVAASFWIYLRATGYGLFADDFQWLVGAELFHPTQLVDLSNRTHFYRPVLEVYFPAALLACGRSAGCYHWLSIALHIGTSALVGAVAATAARSLTVGFLAALLFAVQPAPTEAVVWISAISEVMATAFFVLTIWLFWRAVSTRRTVTYAAAGASFVACLLTHESGITLIVVLALSLWLLPAGGAAERAPKDARRRFAALAPFAVAFIAYAAVAYIVNSRNYLVAENQYAFGPHMLTNVVNALVTLAVARREWPAVFAMAVLALWAVAAAPPRIRFYTLWIVVTLVPFAGFRDGLSSRYLYLPAVGFAALAAEVLWTMRAWLVRSSRWGVATWWIITIGLTARFATFAVKNVRTLERAAAPYRQYVDTVRSLYPQPPPGAHLQVPPPPPAIPPHYVPSVLQWEYGDVTLDVSITDPTEQH